MSISVNQIMRHREGKKRMIIMVIGNRLNGIIYDLISKRKIIMHSIYTI